MGLNKALYPRHVLRDCSTLSSGSWHWHQAAEQPQHCDTAPWYGILLFRAMELRERTAAHKTAQAHGGLISKCVQSTQKLKQSLMFLQLRVFLPSCAALAVDSFRVVVVRGGAHAVQGRAACVAHGGDHPERVSGEAARLDARNTGTAQLSYEPYTPRDRRPTQNDALVRLTFCASWFRSLKC